MAIESFDDLISFLRHFHRGWMDDPSLEADEVPDDLPEPLGRLYREFGALIEIAQDRSNDHRPPFGAQDALCQIDRLKRFEGMVEFAWENQGNWAARAPLDAFDPPVYSNSVEEWEPPQSGFQIVCPLLTRFLTTFCLQEAVMSSRYLGALDWAPLEEKISCELAPLWLRGPYVGDVPLHDFYHVPGHDIIVMDHHIDLWIGSTNENPAWIVRPGESFEVLH
jgi:hypothetical protein